MSLNQLLEIPRYMLDYITPENIEFTPPHPQRGSIADFFDERFYVNPTVPEDQQVKAVLLVSLRYHPAFIAYTGGLQQGSMDKDERIEEDIENAAEGVYQSNPDVVARIRDTLSKAKQLQQARDRAFGFVSPTVQ